MERDERARLSTGYRRFAEDEARGKSPLYEELARGVAAVMSFSPASVELAWMETRPGEFRRLVGENGEWGLFSVIGSGGRDIDR